MNKKFGFLVSMLAAHIALDHSAAAINGTVDHLIVGCMMDGRAMRIRAVGFRK
jgi:hypothetical protein